MLLSNTVYVSHLYSKKSIPLRGRGELICKNNHVTLEKSKPVTG
jgi:hypothetical protein